MSRILYCALIAGLLGLVASACAQDAPRYAVTFDGKTLQINVTLCLAQAHPQVSFSADSADAMHFVHDLRRTSDNDVEAGDGQWSAAEWHAGECLSYQADLAAIAAVQDPDIGWRAGEDLVSAPQLWLLRPDVQGSADATLQMALPAGWNISAPWIPELSASAPRPAANGYFSIPNTPADWSASVALGHFDEERISLPGGTLRLVILHGGDQAQRTKLHDWLAHVSRAVLSAYGRLPLPDVQVLLIPVAETGLTQHVLAAVAPHAVHFGQSTRGQGNALQLLVDPSRPLAEFNNDWTAVHELSHLMHPYLGDRGSWLAEGLATYYQNILRARGGLLTPAQAWDRLQEGFAAAANAPVSGTLEDAATHMQRNHAYQRVYWAGAAYWLTVDRDLRRASNGQQRLELALSRFRDCCLPSYRQWRPEDFVAKLDVLLGVQAFSRRYRQFSTMQQFPDWKKLYSELGIRTDGARISFDADAADAAAREAITTAQPGSAGDSP